MYYSLKKGDKVYHRINDLEYVVLSNNTSIRRMFGRPTYLQCVNGTGIWEDEIIKLETSDDWKHYTPHRHEVSRLIKQDMDELAKRVSELETAMLKLEKL